MHLSRSLSFIHVFYPYYPQRAWQIKRGGQERRAEKPGAREQQRKEGVDPLVFAAVWFWLWSSTAWGPNVAALMKRAPQPCSSLSASPPLLQPVLQSPQFLPASPRIRLYLLAFSNPSLPPCLYPANVIHVLCSSRDLLRQQKEGIFTDQSDGVELCSYCTLSSSSITATTAATHGRFSHSERNKQTCTHFYAIYTHICISRCI